jgi:hypothetical protein
MPGRRLLALCSDGCQTTYHLVALPSFLQWALMFVSQLELETMLGARMRGDPLFLLCTEQLA